MRMVLRAAAHRELSGGGREIAASPDTLRREAWRWQVRLLVGGNLPSDAPVPDAHRETAPLPGGRSVEVVADPASVTSALDVLGVGAGTTVRRTPDEIVILLACDGPVRVAARHLLDDADALVLEGEEPPAVRVEPAGGASPRLAVIRLGSTDGAALRWVP